MVLQRLDKTLQLLIRILIIPMFALFALGIIPGLFVLWVPALVLAVIATVLGLIKERIEKKLSQAEMALSESD